jgi:hypothetical protein
MTNHVAYLKKLGYERAAFVTMQEVLDALFDKDPKVVNFAFGLADRLEHEFEPRDAYSHTRICRKHGFARIYVISGPTA